MFQYKVGLRKQMDFHKIIIHLHLMNWATEYSIQGIKIINVTFIFYKYRILLNEIEEMHELFRHKDVFKHKNGTINVKWC